MVVRDGYRAVFGLLVIVLSLIHAALGADPVYILGTDAEGISRRLDVARTPALYTGDFGDCLGGQSLFNITKFDAAYYADNLTVLFHLDGTTNIKNESLMLHISVDAYGENRFEMNFDPCTSNIYSLCPLNASVPVTGWALIPVSPAQVSGILPIALQIPDFEGYARLQIFANSTRTQIGCFQAVMRNGNSFSHPAWISSILGLFTLAAIFSSFATAIYGVSIRHMRTHYAHSFPVLVVFETFQTIFYSGALSVQWPSVLPAWWSNFAWSGFLISSSKMVDAIDPFAGVKGNGSQVGGAGSVVINNGGGIIAQIYGRSLSLAPKLWTRASAMPAYNASNPYDYTWGGNPVSPGMPAPGTWTGFAGTLSDVGIPLDNAFLTGLIWLLVLLGLVVLSMTLFKFGLDLMAHRKWIKEDRLAYFRAHLPGYLTLGVLRTLLIAFFSMITLSLIQFNVHAAVGPTVIAVIVFLFFLGGMGGVVAYACYFRLRSGKYDVVPDTVMFERGKLFKAIPFVAATRQSKLGEKESAEKPLGSMGIRRIKYTDDDPDRVPVHKDEGYIKRFGWLSARYRRTRWWFFAFWLSYQFIRACFLGGAVKSPLTQVYGLFVFEIIALIVFIKLNPFEGNRNTVLAIWLLGICKVATAGFSIAFLADFNVNRIIATVFGVIIIVVQGVVVITMMVLVTLSVISSWMSLSRNREEFSENLDETRIKYFEHIEAKALDMPAEVKSKKDKKKQKQEPEVPKEPYFSVNNVRRAPKIEDEDEDAEDALGEIDVRSRQVSTPVGLVNRPSRTNSVSSRRSVSSLPRGARVHRASWSSKDFAQWDAQQAEAGATTEVPEAVRRHSRNNSLRVAALRSQSSLTQLRVGTESPALEHQGSANMLRRPMTPTRELSEEYVTTLSSAQTTNAANRSENILAGAEERLAPQTIDERLAESPGPTMEPPKSQRPDS